MMDRLFSLRKRISVITVFVLMFFGINYSLEYATDTYSTFFEQDSWTYSIYQNGRVLQAFIFYAVEKLGLSGPKCYYASWIIAVVSLTAAITLLSVVLERHVKNEYFSTAIAFVTIVNPLIIEYFLFVEKGMFMVLILLTVIAIDLTDRIFEEPFDTRQFVIRAVLIQLCLIAVASTYQVIVGAYVVGCLPLIVMRSDRFIKKNVFVAVMYGIPMGVAVITARLLEIPRLGKFQGLVQGLRNVAAGVYSVVLRNFAHMRNGRMLLLVLVSVLLVVISVLTERKLSVVLSYLYIIAGSILVGFLLAFMSSEASLSPRVIYPFGMLFGVLLTYFASLQESFDHKKLQMLSKRCGVAAGTLLIALLMIVEGVAFGRAFLERYRCNQADLYYAQIVGEKIRAYEEQTGNIIDTVCYYSDKTRTWSDRGFNESGLSSRAQSCGWSRLTSINTYLGTDYVEGEPEPEYAEYFEDKEWGTYSDEQFVFDGNKLHICIY